MTGEIPAELGSLTNLRVLNLQYNQLTGGIPAELGDLTKPDRVVPPPEQQPVDRGDTGGAGQPRPDLRSAEPPAYNQLTGGIPAELGDLTNLKELRLNNNHLTGEIPAELGNLANLSKLQLDGNQLSGCMPSSLSDQLNMGISDLGGLRFCP